MCAYICQDVVLKAAVKTYQGKCWRRISTHLPGKTEVSTTRTYEYQYMLYHTLPFICVPQIALFFFPLSSRIQFIYSSIPLFLFHHRWLILHSSLCSISLSHIYILYTPYTSTTQHEGRESKNASFILRRCVSIHLSHFLQILFKSPLSSL